MMSRSNRESREIPARNLKVGDLVGSAGWTVARITRTPDVVCAVSTSGNFSLALPPNRKIAVR